LWQAQSLARYFSTSPQTSEEKVKGMARKKSQEDTDSDYRSVSAMADRLGLKGEGRERYVHKHMTTLGHSAQRRYVPAKEDKDSDDDDDDGFF
jgi:hypothetical protein